MGWQGVIENRNGCNADRIFMKYVCSCPWKGDVDEVLVMEKENFSDDDLARLTAESPQWAGRGTLKIGMVVLQTVFS